MSQFIRREQVKQGASGASSGAVVPDDVSKPYPALWEYLSLDRWDDGRSREVASLTLFWGDGRLKCALNDKANKRVLFAAGESLGALLATLESLLASGDAEWKVSAQFKPKKG